MAVPASTEFAPRVMHGKESISSRHHDTVAKELGTTTIDLAQKGWSPTEVESKSKAEGNHIGEGYRKSEFQYAIAISSK